MKIKSATLYFPFSFFSYFLGEIEKKIYYHTKVERLDVINEVAFVKIQHQNLETNICLILDLGSSLIFFSDFFPF